MTTPAAISQAVSIRVLYYTNYKAIHLQHTANNNYTMPLDKLKILSFREVSKPAIFCSAIGGRGDEFPNPEWPVFG